MRAIIHGLIGCLVAVVAASALAQPAPQKLAGQVVSLDGSTLRMKAGEQTMSVALSDKVRISERSRAEVSSIVPGEYIGVTAMPQADGTLLASEVQIFPASMRGTGEGHRPMQAPAGATMTNATVSSVTPASTNTMTNATVATVAPTSRGSTLKLTYSGGEKTVVVPGDAVVFATSPGTRDLLVPGAPVVVYATPDSGGALTADRLSIGKEGYVPPR